MDLQARGCAEPGEQQPLGIRSTLLLVPRSLRLAKSFSWVLICSN